MEICHFFVFKILKYIAVSQKFCAAVWEDKELLENFIFTLVRSFCRLRQQGTVIHLLQCLKFIFCVAAVTVSQKTCSVQMEMEN